MTPFSVTHLHAKVVFGTLLGCACGCDLVVHRVPRPVHHDVDEGAQPPHHPPLARLLERVLLVQLTRAQRQYLTPTWVAN